MLNTLTERLIDENKKLAPLTWIPISLQRYISLACILHFVTEPGGMEVDWS